MALSSSSANAVQLESGARVSLRPTSLIDSGFSTHGSAAHKIPGASCSQQQCSSLLRQSLELEGPEFQQACAIQGKEATTHDFLSLYGSGSASSTETIATRGLPSSVTTKDFLQPLEKGVKPTSGLLSHGLVTSANRLHNNSAEKYATGQQASYALVNGTLELPSNVHYRLDRVEGVTEGMKERLENLAHWSSVQLKFRPSDASYASNAHALQTIPAMNKQWQQQLASPELFELSKRPQKAASEDDDDEDESLDQGHNSAREGVHQKNDTSQKLEGKNSDCKGTTPRSKHSATEQRRRSKINDRFQMLRQLLPNVDQKRDKASFLLEVIDYIQILQEKVRKFEAAEQGRQQDRFKNVPWDVRNHGCRDSSAVAPHVPLVSTIPPDTKQVPDSNGYMRPRLSHLASSCENEVSGEDLVSSMGQAAAFSDRSAQGFQASHANYGNKAVTSKHMPLALSSQSPAVCVPGRISIPHATSEAHAILRHMSHHEEQAILPFPESNSPLCNKAEVVASSHLLVNDVPSLQTSNNVSEVDHEKSKIAEHCQRSLNHGMPNEELEPVNSSLDLHPTKEGTSLKESKLHGDSTPLDVHSSEAEQNGGRQEDEQGPLTIHGGVITVSSTYSQGLLDTLTRALQSSGLDLSKATISVQIELGNSNGPVLTSCRKTATVSTANSQQQSRDAGSSPEFGHPRKKPKVEVDL